ncbi:universal stress protein [Streptomyces tauricus]
MPNAISSEDRPIIVGIDDGPHQEAIVRFAARQAERRGSRLQILHAIRFPLPGGSAADNQERALAADAGARLVKWYEDFVRSEYSTLTVAGKFPVGDAATVLIERSGDAQQLVVGHCGSGGFPRLPLGSVSWQVATRARCPVIVVRPGDTDGAPDNRVVVGADPADGSLEALDFAYQEADLLGARLDVVYAAYHPGAAPVGPVMAPPDFNTSDPGPRDFLEKEITQRHERYPSVETDLRMERTRPAALLTDAAGAQPCWWWDPGAAPVSKGCCSGR